MQTSDEIRKILEQLDVIQANDLEDETLEFKEFPGGGINKLYEIAIEYSVCFANVRGGTIVFGVRSGKVGLENAIIGCPRVDFSDLINSVYNSTDPKITISCEEMGFKGKRLLLVHIPSGEGIYYTDTSGHAKVRIGRNCQPYTGSMRQSFPFKMGFQDFTAQLIFEPWNKLVDPEEIERLRKVLKFRYPNSPLLTQNNQDFLISLGLLKEDENEIKLTYAGLLLTGKKIALRKLLPQHEVTYLKMISETEYNIRRDLHNAILKILDTLQEAISSFNPVFTLKLGLIYHEISAFHEEVYREAILNAITHRDYSELGGRVIIRHYKDGMEISNPGGFLANITPQNILRAEPVHRNPLLAEALQKLRLVERSGIGVDRMFKIQLSHGKEPPYFESDSNSVKVSLLNGAVDEPFARFVREEEEKGNYLDLDELLILSSLSKRRELTTSEMAGLLIRNEQASRNILQRMCESGYTERSGRKRGTIYHLSRSVYDKLGKSIEYIRERGIDEIKFEELILKWVKERGSINNREVRQLCNVNRNQATRLLSRLVKEKKLKLQGKTKGAIYTITK